MFKKYLLTSCFFWIVGLLHAQTYKTLWIDELPISTYSEGMRPVQLKTNYGKDTMRMGNLRFTRGLGAQSPCVIPFLIDGKAKSFHAIVGADNQGNKDIPISFFVVGDGKVLFESKEMKIGDPPVEIHLNLAGIKRLGLLITDHVGGVGNKKTYGNWANAQIETIDGKAPGHIPNDGQKYILTPPSPKQPKIHAAKLFGATPGNPFLFTIATTGERPIQYIVEGLPAGLTLAKETGIISGSVKARGDYAVVLKAKNKYGAASQKLTIRIGDTIALTPPMGWNGWNAWEQRLDREKVLASANAMVSKGLRDHGWSYVNIDDSWQGVRSGPDTALQPNAKFPDIKGMVDQIHGMGLKAGLYSTPYISSYGGYPGASSDMVLGGENREMIMKNNQSFHKIGKYQFEKNDARQMAAWGFDFLKYDWRIDVASTERMATALKLSGRDMVYSLSNNAPFEKVTDWVRLSHMYRTGPDIKDSWSSLFPTSFSLDKWAPYSGHGHWMDPDMMIVGDVSIGPVLHPTRLTPDEQYSHVSIFSLLAAPMLIGCPVERLDAFTLNLLTNDEVIEVNQDPLGKAGRLVKNDPMVQVWLKPLEDGSYAIGLFNIAGYGTTPISYFRIGNEPPIRYQLDLAALGLKGKWKIRDLWRQKDLGVFNGQLSTDIPYHGVKMYRITKAQ